MVIPIRFDRPFKPAQIIYPIRPAAVTFPAATVTAAMTAMAPAIVTAAVPPMVIAALRALLTIHPIATPTVRTGMATPTIVTVPAAIATAAQPTDMLRPVARRVPRLRPGQTTTAACLWQCLRLTPAATALLHTQRQLPQTPTIAMAIRAPAIARLILPAHHRPTAVARRSNVILRPVIRPAPAAMLL